MKLKTAIEEFLYHKSKLDLELFCIFVPIIYEVKLKNTKSLLFPPILETLGVN
jgi:hypothetical protein